MCGVASLALAVSMVGLTGCASSKAPADRTSGQIEDDKRIQKDVETALKQAPVYKYPNVNVSVYRGQVALGGFVMTEPQKHTALRIAQGIPGVRVVNDALMVEQNPGPPIVGQTGPPPVVRPYGEPYEEPSEQPTK
jgi:osmotically-inducible protein OsmY